MSRANLADLLEGDQNEVVAVLDNALTLRAEMRAMAVELARGLQEHGLRHTAIGVLLPNTPAAIGAWFGIWQVDSAFVPLNPRVPRPSWPSSSRPRRSRRW